jgi:CPA2 family monovalent cation:H+ antiporter-2
MLLNAALIAAVFVGLTYLAQRPPQWLKGLGLEPGWMKSALWLVGMTLSLPIFIATSRKLQALGLLIAETRVSEKAAGVHTAAIRSVVAQVIPITGTVMLGGYVIILSSTFLTTFKVFLILLVLVALIALLLRRSFIRVYSKAQVALQQTLAETARPDHAPAITRPLPSLLREANLKTVSIAAGTSTAGKRIREIGLRTQSGASIVGIEREAVSILNPDPDEELKAGDHVLLLGTAKQLADAEKVLKE